jgi:hypothetical protein
MIDEKIEVQPILVYYKDVVSLTKIIAIDNSSKMQDSIKDALKKIIDELNELAASDSRDVMTAHVNGHFTQMNTNHPIVRDFLKDMYRKLL